MGAAPTRDDGRKGLPLVKDWIVLLICLVLLIIGGVLINATVRQLIAMVMSL